MKFLFRFLKSAFVRHLAAEGLEVVEKAALETLKANQKRKRAKFAGPYTKEQLLKAEGMRNAAHNEAVTILNSQGIANTTTEVTENG